MGRSKVVIIVSGYLSFEEHFVGQQWIAYAILLFIWDEMEPWRRLINVIGSRYMTGYVRGFVENCITCKLAEGTSGKQQIVT